MQEKSKTVSLANTRFGVSVLELALSFFSRGMTLGVTLVRGSLSSLSVCIRVCCLLFFSLSM